MGVRSGVNLLLTPEVTSWACANFLKFNFVEGSRTTFSHLSYGKYNFSLDFANTWQHETTARSSFWSSF